MTTDDPESQAERRRVLRNDERVRNQSRNGDTSSYIDHYSPEMGGRFSSEGAATVVGTTPNPCPPLPENSPWRSDPVPDEPPLGYRIDAMPEPESPTGVSPVSPPVVTDDPANAPSGGSLVQQPYGGPMSERAGSSPSRQDQTKSRSD
jgi:hypothetical protein